MKTGWLILSPKAESQVSTNILISCAGETQTSVFGSKPEPVLGVKSRDVIRFVYSPFRRGGTQIIIIVVDKFGAFDLYVSV